jgi:HD-like signal output (HDOD) protein/CheY-like chemotaxis protein
MAMKRLLFVDDEATVLEATELMLSGMRGQWDMRFVSSGADALKAMAAGPADAVISDMRMPGMTGAELLNEVMEKYPRTIRFALSGYTDTDTIMSCVGGTHQFLAKPCNTETLQTAILRALSMGDHVNNDQIQALVKQLKTLPSLPSLYFDILRELRSPNTPLERIGALMARDPGMTVKILHVVNSVFFGLGRPLTDPTEAVVQLGLETIKSLVLVLHIFSQFDSSPGVKMRVQELHHHSLATGVMARRIARLAKREPWLADECFTAGLLHDIGRLVLVANLPYDSGRATAEWKEKGIPMADAERAVFGASHADVGGYLLALWGLPMPLVEAAAFHHSPGASSGREFTPLTAVHVADALSHEHDQAPAGELAQLDEAYLAEVGIWEKLPAWRDEINAAKTDTARV